jgi:hypothetical protein
MSLFEYSVFLIIITVIVIMMIEIDPPEPPL